VRAWHRLYPICRQDGGSKFRGMKSPEYREVIKTEVYGELMRNDLGKDLTVSDEEINN